MWDKVERPQLIDFGLEYYGTLPVSPKSRYAGEICHTHMLYSTVPVSSLPN